MENLLVSQVKPDILNENKITIHSFLRESYNMARDQWNHGVDYFKGEFSSFQDKTSQCIGKMLMPVNNFLKDITQMEAEFREECHLVPPHYICLDGKILPAEKVLSQPMEENY